MKFGLKMGLLAVSASLVGACASGAGPTGGTSAVGVQPAAPTATRTLMSVPDEAAVGKMIAELPARLSFADAKRLLVPFPGKAEAAGAKTYSLKYLGFGYPTFGTTAGLAHMRLRGAITDFGLGFNYMGNVARGFYMSGIYQPLTNYTGHFLYAARGSYLFPFYSDGTGYLPYRNIYDTAFGQVYPNALLSPFGFRGPGGLWSHAYGHVSQADALTTADNLVLNVWGGAIDRSDVALRSGGTIAFVNRDAEARTVTDQTGAQATDTIEAGGASQPMVVPAGLYGYGIGTALARVPITVK